MSRGIVLRYELSDIGFVNHKITQIRKKIKKEKVPEPRKNSKFNKKIDELFAPLGIAKFSAEYLGQRPFHFKAKDRARLEKYYSYSALSSLLTSGLPAQETLIYDADSQLLPLERISSFVGKSLIVNPRKVAANFRSGKRFTFKFLEKFDSTVGALVSDLQSSLGFDSAFVNMYLSPNRGHTGWHYDSQDVLVMQVEGKKAWNIYEPVYRMPLLPDQFQETGFLTLKKSDTKLKTKLILEKGDLLYIPACFPHEVTSVSNDNSLHLAFCFPLYQRHQILRSVLLESLDQHLYKPEFRAAIFNNSNGNLSPEEKGKLLQLVQDVVGKIDESSFERKYSEYLANQINPQPNLQLKNLKTLFSGYKLRADSKLSRTNVNCSVEFGDDEIRVQSQRCLAALKPKAKEAVNFTTGKKVIHFRLKDIPGRLNATEKEELTWALIDMGVLTVED